MKRRISGATGALVLSTALLISGAGGAIATADTGSGDSTSRSSSASDNSSQPSTANSSRDADPGNREPTTLRDVVRGATSALDRALRPSWGADRTRPAADSEDDSIVIIVDGDPSESVTDDVFGLDDDLADAGPAESELISETPAESEAEVPLPVDTGSGTDAEAAAPHAAGSSTGGSGGSTSSGFSSTSPHGPSIEDAIADEAPGAVVAPAPFHRLVNRMTTVAVSLGSAAAAIPTTVFALPFSQTPLSDIIALWQTVLTSVGESAFAAAQLPADFAALFGIYYTGPDTVVIGPPSHSRTALMGAPGLPAVAGPHTVSPALPAQPANQAEDRGPGFGILSPTALMAYTAPLQTVPASPLAPTGEHQSLVDRAFGALLLPLSLWALATGALPGLAGLLVVFGAGIRVGYRQAKAGFALKVAGIARYAGSGPLGVVRSGSLIAIHQRSAQPNGPRPVRWSRLGDQAA